LQRLGYVVDTSVLPDRSFTHQSGPNFFGFPPNPYWIDAERTILELPISSASVGPLSSAPRLVSLLTFGRKIIPALSNTGLLDRIRLTPEGITTPEAKKLVNVLLSRGTRVFTLSYHSPSLVPGMTPYVRTVADLDRFLHWLDSFYEFFFGEIDGEAATPTTIYDLALKADYRFGIAPSYFSESSASQNAQELGRKIAGL
jgi:hypothetical protein